MTLIGKKAERTQIDGKQDAYSAATALDTSDLPDLTRQEFREEADVNHLLARYGIGGLPQRTPRWGEEIDFDMDLQSAYISTQGAMRAWAHLPADLKTEFPTWQDLLNGYVSGKYQEAKKAYDDRKKDEARPPEPIREELDPS